MTEQRTRRLAAVWFADIVGYTSLSAQDEDAALSVVDELQRIANAAVDQHGGRVVKYIGDAVLTVFDSANSALQSAFELQDAFSKSEVAQQYEVALRVGLHLGEVVEAPDGDVYGDGVNTASRIESVARPGEVAVTEAVFHQIRNRPQYHAEPLGKKELKGLKSMAVYSVRLSDAPPARPKVKSAPLSYRRAVALGVGASIIGFASLTVMIAQTQQQTESEPSGQDTDVSQSGGTESQQNAGAVAEGTEDAEGFTAGIGGAEDTTPGPGEVDPSQANPSSLDETATGDPASTPESVTAVPPADFGNWDVDIDRNPMGDAQYATLTLAATRGDAKLRLECGASRSISIEWPRPLASDEVQVRVEQSRARTIRNLWELVGGTVLMFRGDARRYRRDLAGVESFAVEARAVQGPPMSAVFRLTGLAQALEEARPACAR